MSSTRSRRGGRRTEIKILAEQTLLDQNPQVLVRCGDDADIGLDRYASADCRVFTLLKHAEQARLRLHRHVTDLIEEERAALGLLEAPGIARGRARKSALLVTEQLGLDQFSRDRRHVDGDERPLAALAVIMQRLRHQLLAGAGLARDHHGEIRGHQSREGAVDFLHGMGAADERDIFVLRARRIRHRIAWARERASHDSH